MREPGIEMTGLRRLGGGDGDGGARVSTWWFGDERLAFGRGCSYRPERLGAWDGRRKVGEAVR
jgi:hypothetical protein